MQHREIAGVIELQRSLTVVFRRLSRRAGGAGEQLQQTVDTRAQYVQVAHPDGVDARGGGPQRDTVRLPRLVAPARAE